MDEIHDSQDLIEEILPRHETPLGIEDQELAPHESLESLESEDRPAHESLESLDDTELFHEAPEGLGDMATEFESLEPLESLDTGPGESLESLESPVHESPESLESLESPVHESPESLGFIEDFQPEEIPQLPNFNEADGIYDERDEVETDWEEIDFAHEPLGELTDSVFHEQYQVAPMISSVSHQPTEFPRQFPSSGHLTANTYWMS